MNTEARVYAASFSDRGRHVPRNTRNVALEAGKAWKWDFSF